MREERYSVDQWRADAASGRLREAFACGTAAVVTSIGRVCGAGGDFAIADDAGGPVADRLRNELVGIQRGVRPDRHAWLAPAT